MFSFYSTVCFLPIVVKCAIKCSLPAYDNSTQAAAQPDDYIIELLEIATQEQVNYQLFYFPIESQYCCLSALANVPLSTKQLANWVYPVTCFLRVFGCRSIQLHSPTVTVFVSLKKFSRSLFLSVLYHMHTSRRYFVRAFLYNALELHLRM